MVLTFRQCAGGFFCKVKIKTPLRLDQNDGMKVVTNGTERIKLLLNNELSFTITKNHNNNQGFYISSRINLRSDYSCTVACLLFCLIGHPGAVNDITSGKEPHMLPDFLLQKHQLGGKSSNLKSAEQESSYDSNQNGSDSVSMDIDLNDGKILLDFANSQEREREISSFKNNVKIVNVSSLSDEYVDINDMKSINEK